VSVEQNGNTKLVMGAGAYLGHKLWNKRKAQFGQ